MGCPHESKSTDAGHRDGAARSRIESSVMEPDRRGPVDGVVGIEGGVVSGVINLESSGVGASDWRPRHGKHYQEV